MIFLVITQRHSKESQRTSKRFGYRLNGFYFFDKKLGSCVVIKLPKELPLKDTKKS